MNEKPVILTLDAGGTTFTFTALQDEQPLIDSFTLHAHSDDLDLSIETMIKGFYRVIDEIGTKPDAISFAFPGPADYKHGIIGDLPNLTGYRGGVPLGPILEEEFQIPVYINNDGDLFALGESRSGFLPYVNELLERSGNPKRYKNLVGVTLGTGFGVGISINGRLLQGDNSAAAEGWKLRNKQFNYTNIEDTISIKALKRIYAEQIAISPENAPDPVDLARIAKGEIEGVQPAAREVFLRFGDALGDALAHLTTIVDGLIVIGGGVSGAYDLFSGAMLDEMNGYFTSLNGIKQPRLLQKVYNLENSWQTQEFTTTEHAVIVTNKRLKRKVYYQPEKKTGIGLSRLGTSKAISLGAYHFAMNRLTE
tara:strand:- start:12442 stop:13539 length:1098 start_codon:yes stop_codon:yes gene_type:complete